MATLPANHTEGCGSPMPVFASDRVCLSGTPEPQPPAVEYRVQTVGRAMIPGPTGTR